jgi:hypothetical protein
MLDSGAFSLWKTGEVLDLEKYCDFIQANADWIASYVNLDHIDPRDTNTSAQRSLDNYRRMRARGLHPIPVFHLGEDIKFLHTLLDAGAGHISLASNKFPQPVALQWYDTVWRVLADAQGYATVRVHGLAITNMTAMVRYPWYSVDSSSWLQFAQRYATGKLPGSKAKVGARKDGAAALGAIDMDLLGAGDAHHLQVVCATFDISMDVFKDRNQATMLALNVLTALHYMELGEQVDARAPIRFKAEAGLFTGASATRHNGKPINHLLLYLATGSNIQWSLPTLAAAGCNAILVSYYDILRSSRWGCLKDYVRDPKGTVDGNEIFAKQLAQIKQFIKW